MKRRDEKIKRLREGLKPDKEDFKPVRCLYCGFEKVCKNGTYKRGRKGFFDKLKQDEQKEEVVQGFLCPWCGRSFHIEKKGFSPRSHKG